MCEVILEIDRGLHCSYKQVPTLQVYSYELEPEDEEGTEHLPLKFKVLKACVKWMEKRNPKLKGSSLT